MDDGRWRPPRDTSFSPSGMQPSKTDNGRGSDANRYTYVSPHLGEHLAHQPSYSGGGAATTAYAEDTCSPQLERAVVTCPSCKLQLYAPLGAPVFACPCGQLMQPPADAGSTGGPPGPSNSWHADGRNADGRNAESRNAPGSNAGAVGPYSAFMIPPDPPDSIFELPAYGGPRSSGGMSGSPMVRGPSLSPSWTVPVPHIACPRCSNLIAGTADMMICDICGLRMSGVLSGRPVALPTPGPRKRSFWERFWSGN